MKVAMTGHRADKVALYNKGYIRHQIRAAFNDLKADLVIQGMCDGIDLMAAKYAYDLHIPFWSVRPWMGHHAAPGWQDWYLNARVYAERVIVLDKSKKYTGPWLYHNRNKWMVDNCDVVVAVWDGERSGGTFATVRYALGKKPIWHINPKAYEVGWLTEL